MDILDEENRSVDSSKRLRLFGEISSFSSSSELAKNGGGMGGIWDMVTVETRNALIQRDLLRDATLHVIA